MAAIGYTYDPHRAHLNCLMDALVARATNQTPKDPLAQGYLDGDAPLLASLAHACLMAQGRDHGLHPAEHRGRVISLALTTPDFPFAIGSAFGKVLLPAYTHARPAYRLLGARRDFQNFRATNLVPPAAFPLPTRVGESGEVRLGAFTDAGETGSLASYASGLIFSRQSLVNDDAAVLGALATAAALRSVDLEDQLFFALLTSGASANGPTLRDGAQLFAAARGNLAGTGAAISATTISTARAAMMNATGPDGTKSVATPRYLVCPPALLTLAEAEVGKLSPGADPALRMTPISTPNLSGTAWYLFADPAQLPTLAYSYLAGAPGPVVVTSPHWESEGVQFRLTLDFGVTAVDGRGAWKNPGA